MKVEYKLVLAILGKMRIYADAFGRNSDQIISGEKRHNSSQRLLCKKLMRSEHDNEKADH
jgi:hypothetical protein